MINKVNSNKIIIIIIILLLLLCQKEILEIKLRLTSNIWIKKI